MIRTVRLHRDQTVDAGDNVAACGASNRACNISRRSSLNIDGHMA